MIHLRSVTIGVLLLCCLVVSAIPARKGIWKILKLQDGTEVRATMVGDEHGSWWKAEDGKTYRKMTGTDYYQAVDVQQIAQKARIKRHQANHLFSQHMSARRSQRAAGSSAIYSGTKRCVILLVQFPDLAFQPENNKQAFERVANEEGYHEGNFVGSVADYFRKQSKGLFEIAFDVVGPMTVSKGYAHYGKPTKEDTDSLPGDMIKEAVKMAKDSLDNWEQYDWDKNGEVDQIYVIYAGHSHSDGEKWEDNIWPHAWSLSSAKYYKMGGGMVAVGKNLVVDNYACGSELNYDGQIDGPGTMCHEFSHCLGYPDFYDIDYEDDEKYGQGMDSWDLMDYGPYNGDGYVPPGYTLYERWMAGWMEPIVLGSENVSVKNMQPLENGGDGYVIYNPENNDEYFLLENRQLTGWDAAIPAPGLLIIHADYDEEAWAANGPNDDPKHQRMTWVPADHQYQWNKKYFYYTYDGVKTDIFPQEDATSFNKDFAQAGDETIVTNAIKFYNKKDRAATDIKFSIQNITQNSDGTINFDYIANYEGETAIRTITSDEHTRKGCYTLDGRRIDNNGQQLKSGLYLIDGKKVVIK